MDTQLNTKCIRFKGKDPWGLPGTTRWGCIITVVRLTIACVLLWYGTLYVVHTINLSDLVLNCFVAPMDLGRDRRVIHFFKYSTPPKRNRTDLFIFNFIYLYMSISVGCCSSIFFGGSIVLQNRMARMVPWSTSRHCSGDCSQRALARDFMQNPSTVTVRQHHSSAEIMDIPVYIYI